MYQNSYAFLHNINSSLYFSIKGVLLGIDLPP